MVTGFHIGITEEAQSAEENTSQVTVALTITWNGGSYNATGNAAGVLVIDGTVHDFKAVFNTAQKTSGSEVFYSKTVQVAHKEDGSKTLVCTASFATGTAVGTVTAEAEKELTVIPRESTVGATDASIGSVCAISVYRKNSGYTHSIAYQFGDLHGYIADAGGSLSTEECRLSETRIFFPIPASFYEQIPESRTGSCVLTVRTYSGSAQVGEEKIASFTVTAAEELCKPLVSGTVKDINTATVSLTGDDTKLVRSMSTALCRISAQARNGARLVSKTIGGTSVEEDSLEIAAIELPAVEFTAADSRGYVANCKQKLNIIEYVCLTQNVSAVRTDPTSGNAVLRVSGNYFNSSFGAEENSLSVRYRIGNGPFTEMTPLTDGNGYTASVELSGLDYQSAYSITVEAADKLETLTKTVMLGKGMPVFDWGEKDFQFHVPVRAPSFNGMTAEYMQYRGACQNLNTAYLSGVYRLNEASVNTPSENGMLLVFNGNGNSQLAPILQMVFNFDATVRKLRMLWYGTVFEWIDF